MTSATGYWSIFPVHSPMKETHFMLRRVVGLVAVGFAVLAVASSGDAQEKDGKRLQELIAKLPTPAKKDGKLAEIDKEATDAVVAELCKDPARSVAGLVDLLSTKGGDTQARLAVHAIVMRLGGDQNVAS